LGRLDNIVTSTNRGDHLLPVKRHLRDVIRASGRQVADNERPGVHHEINWEDRLADALPFAFPPSR
jgi:hypothetical protein